MATLLNCCWKCCPERTDTRARRMSPQGLHNSQPAVYCNITTSVSGVRSQNCGNLNNCCKANSRSRGFVVDHRHFLVGNKLQNGLIYPPTKAYDPCDPQGSYRCTIFIVKPHHVIELCASDPLCCLKAAKLFFRQALDYDYPDSARVQKVIMGPGRFLDENGHPLDSYLSEMVARHEAIKEDNFI